MHALINTYCGLYRPFSSVSVLSWKASNARNTELETQLAPSNKDTPFFPPKIVLIREVSFGQSKNHMHSWYQLPRFCILSTTMYKGVLSTECPLREGPQYPLNNLRFSKGIGHLIELIPYMSIYSIYTFFSIWKVNTNTTTSIGTLVVTKLLSAAMVLPWRCLVYPYRGQHENTFLHFGQPVSGDTQHFSLECYNRYTGNHGNTGLYTADTGSSSTCHHGNPSVIYRYVVMLQWCTRYR